MKFHPFILTALLIGASLSADSLRASLAPNAGQTTLELGVEFGIAEVPPSRVTVPPTEHLLIKSDPAMAGFSNYGWYKDGHLIVGATAPNLLIDVAQPSDSGLYKYDSLETDHSGRGSQLLYLQVRPAPSLVNLSTRGFAGQGDQTFICGFVIAEKSGSNSMSTVLIRAVGPTLARFGVSGVLAEPKIAIFSADGTPYTGNFQYPSESGYPTRESHLQAVTAMVGAFPLDQGAKDAVELRPFPPGNYTVHVTGANSATGNVLVETYQVPER